MLEIVGASNLENLRSHTKGRGRRLCPSQYAGTRLKRGIPEDGHVRHHRDRFLEQLNTFPGEIVDRERDSRNVSSRPREGGNEPGANGINTNRHDDRDRRGCMARGVDAFCRYRHDHVDSQPDEFSGESRETVEDPFGESVLGQQVLSLDVTPVTQTPSKGVFQWRIRRDG
jgi:hypothetical protein